MEVNWDFFNANIELISNFCESDTSALGVSTSAERFESLWIEVVDVYLGYLKGLVMWGQEFEILSIVLRDMETGLVSTTAVRIVEFMLGYFVGCRYGWIGDRFQAPVKALLDGEDFSAYIKQHCHECGLDYWEGNGQTWSRLGYLSNYYAVVGDPGASTGLFTADSALTGWR
ncbi:hypothetical protein BKA65DRAFT_554838 [Rhexocercosporidium sp. MPI-PUGE-AT-0058]|nr:hypothetical protein BKA65DRAFT_554838 [Rhexocercosporidium sp. MPI-PUGE-AT-0058]